MVCNGGININNFHNMKDIQKLDYTNSKIV